MHRFKVVSNAFIHIPIAHAKKKGVLSKMYFFLPNIKISDFYGYTFFTEKLLHSYPHTHVILTLKLIWIDFECVCVKCVPKKWR